ncbi:MAG: hypothetical protein KDD64_14900 [Bdellovibrionales bacterium]|nr:hypothetical protein [Bdellovibrionales bacterium]
MSDERKLGRRAALVDLLYWDHTLSSAVLRDSMLARIGAQQLPWGLHKDFPYGILGSWVMAVLSVFAVFATHEGNLLLALCSAGTAFLVLGAVACYTVQKQSSIQQARVQIAEALVELETQRGLLSNYLEALDRRTSRYFHVVTTSKTTAYAILNQILSEIDLLLEESSKTKDVRWLYERLSRSITVSEGYVSGKGKDHKIPLAQLSFVVADIQQLLEEGLDELEHEINHFKQIQLAQQRHERELLKTH